MGFIVFRFFCSCLGYNEVVEKKRNGKCIVEVGKVGLDDLGLI